MSDGAMLQALAIIIMLLVVLLAFALME